MVTEFEYLLAHPGELGKYVGLWVAVVGERIVASGESAKEVSEEATRMFPGREPFLMKVPTEKVVLLCMSFAATTTPPAGTGRDLAANRPPGQEPGSPGRRVPHEGNPLIGHMLSAARGFLWP